MIKIIYNTSLPVALREAREYADRNKGTILSLPQLVQERIKADKEDTIWTNWFTVNSEEYVGKTKQGNPVLVTSHGQAIWTPDRIEQAYREDLINGAGRLTEPEFHKLLEGKVTVTDLDKIKSTVSGIQRIDELRENPLFILRAGGAERANNYLDRVKEVYQRNEYGNWHTFASVNPAQPQGRVLFVYYDYGNGFYGDISLDVSGQFGVSAPKAHISRASRVDKNLGRAPKLEEVLRTIKPMVAAELHSKLKTVLNKLYR